MRGTFSFTDVPVRARTVEAFAAPDPWHGGRAARWSLEVFRMVNERAEHLYVDGRAKVPQRGEGGRTGSGEVLGLLNPAERRPRLLPVALAQLWQEGGVAAAELPRLMARMEPQTLTSDYFSRMAPLLRWYAAGFLLAALAFGAVAAAAWALSGHSVREVPVGDWLSRPVTREQQVSVEGLVTLAGHVAAGAVRRPDGVNSDGGDFSMQGGGSRDYVLAWYRAGEGERLLLLTPFSAQGVAVGAAVVNVNGAVLETAKLGLSPAVLQAIAARVPGLQGGYITCVGWQWDDWNLIGDPAPILFGGGVFLLLAGFFYAQHRLRLRRIAWFRREFAKLA